MPSYRKPTEKESARLDAARKKTQEGIEGEKDIFSKAMPTMAKSARDDVKAGLKMRESVPASAREGEAYEQAGYKKGGKVMKKMKRYEDGGEVEFESAQGPNKNIGDDVRARAMAAMEKGSSDEPAIPKKTAAKLTPKATPKAETKPTPVAKTGEEKSGFEAKKAKALEGTSVKTEAKPTPKAEPKPAPVARASSEKTGFELKKEKAMGMKAGGKVKSASSRADGCAIRGKTRA
jgi:hypothetical protein